MSTKPKVSFGKKSPTGAASSPEHKRWDLEGFEKKVIEEAKSTGQILSVDKRLIQPDPEQPRTYFDPEALEELRASVSEHGLLQPIVVRPKDDGYIIIAGERRWRAAIGIDSIKMLDVVVRDEADPLTILKLQFAENAHRRDMTPMEVANAYARIKELCGGSQKQTALELGVTESQVSVTLGLLKAPEVVQKLASEGKIGDITTLNLIQRLHKTNPQEALQVVEDVLSGATEDTSLRKQLGSRLKQEKEKGSPSAAKPKKEKRIRIEAESVALEERDGKIVVFLSTAKGSYEIVTNLSNSAFQELLYVEEEA